MQSFAPHFDETQSVLSVGQCQRHSAKCQNDRQDALNPTDCLEAGSVATLRLIEFA
jgi:hypothetical protein